MGLFGASARLRDKSLASPEQYQPMFSPAVPESRPMDENITFPSDLGAAMNIPQIRQGGGAFGRGGVGWSILGAIGDGLSQMGGYGAPFAHQQALLRKQRMDEEQYQRERADRRDDFLFQQNNRVREPYRWESNDGSLMEMGPDGQPRVVYKDPTPKVQWQRVENGDGTFTMVPIVNGQIAGGAAQQARTAPPGVTFTPLPDGGPTHPASGGFPRR